MKIEWLTLLAITIMIIGGVMVYKESRVCYDPMKRIIQNVIGKNLSGVHAELYIFDAELNVKESYSYFEQSGWKPADFKVDASYLENLTINN